MNTDISKQTDLINRAVTDGVDGGEARQFDVVHWPVADLLLTARVHEKRLLRGWIGGYHVRLLLGILDEEK